MTPPLKNKRKVKESRNIKYYNKFCNVLNFPLLRERMLLPRPHIFLAIPFIPRFQQSRVTWDGDGWMDILQAQMKDERNLFIFKCECSARRNNNDNSFFPFPLREDFSSLRRKWDFTFRIYF